MPVASDDYGTLRRRLVGTPLESAVVGKTGTLVHDDGGMASLGGVVYTQRAGKVCFVMLSQGSGVPRRGLPAPLPRALRSAPTPRSSRRCGPWRSSCRTGC